MEFHEVASIFPMMGKDEFEALKTDIAQNGLLEPIWTYQDKIIDGRNRYNACMEVGIIPEYREWRGQGSLIAFVVSLNLKRRHLDKGQIAMIGLDVEKAIAEEARKNQSLAGKYNRHVNDDDNHVFDSWQLLETIPKADIEPIHAAKTAAEILGVNPHYITDAKNIQEKAPDLADKVRAGEMTIPEAKKEVKARETKAARSEIAEKAKELPVSSRWNISKLDITEIDESRINKYDFIITDPPYPKDYIYLYTILEMVSSKYLKPGGLLIAMCGQSYLDEIVKSMGEHLDYYWTAAYLTPGQPTPLRQRQVNTTWKPLLIYSKGNYAGKIFGDVFKSDGNDKDFHKWGQSVSGMLSIISQICLPGEYIYDPFCGAGTTGVAALMHGCLFDGSDIDEQNVNISKYRLSEVDL